MNNNEHVGCWNCRNVCVFLPLNVLRNYASVYACMFGIPAMYHVKFLISALIYPCLCSWGCLAGYCGDHRVLFTNRMGRGRDRVVSELMLQHGPEWTTKVQ